MYAPMGMSLLPSTLVHLGPGSPRYAVVQMCLEGSPNTGWQVCAGLVALVHLVQAAADLLSCDGRPHAPPFVAAFPRPLLLGDLLPSRRRCCFLSKTWISYRSPWLIPCSNSVSSVSTFLLAVKYPNAHARPPNALGRREQKLTCMKFNYLVDRTV